jgi:nucleotide-binding universal stress UspA family protein
MWDELLEPEVESLRADARQAAEATRADVDVDVRQGSPPEALKRLSERVDLLVIGSRRWGPLARVLLGSTGEALMHDAGCPVLVAPRGTR